MRACVCLFVYPIIIVHSKGSFNNDVTTRNLMSFGLSDSSVPLPTYSGNCYDPSAIRQWGGGGGVVVVVVVGVGYVN